METTLLGMSRMFRVQQKLWGSRVETMRFVRFIGLPLISSFTATAVLECIIECCKTRLARWERLVFPEEVNNYDQEYFVQLAHILDELTLVYSSFIMWSIRLDRLQPIWWSVGRFFGLLLVKIWWMTIQKVVLANGFGIWRNALAKGCLWHMSWSSKSCFDMENWLTKEVTGGSKKEVIGSHAVRIW